MENVARSAGWLGRAATAAAAPIEGNAGINLRSNIDLDL